MQSLCKFLQQNYYISIVIILYLYILQFYIITNIMLSIITYNCYNIKSSIQDICDLCNSYDLIFLQEIWLFQLELSLLSNISSEFEGFGTTAMEWYNGIISGRPYGGVAVLIRKSIGNKYQIHTFDDSRLLSWCHY